MGFRPKHKSPTIKLLKENRISSGCGCYQRFLTSSKSPVKFGFTKMKYSCLSWTWFRKFKARQRAKQSNIFDKRTYYNNILKALKINNPV